MLAARIKKIVLSLILKVLFVAMILSSISSAVYSSKLASKAQSVSETDGVIELNVSTPRDEILTTVEQTTAPTLQYGWPTSLTIPSVGIAVEITRGDFINGEWNVSEDKAHYATMTPLPNTFDGNTVIYAHNRPHLFKRTLDVKLDDQVYIKAENGLTFVYSYTGDQIVTPNDVSVFSYKGIPRLTLLTCHGDHDQFRRLLFFSLVKVV